jgi:hypothetical protein
MAALATDVRWAATVLRRATLAGSRLSALGVPPLVMEQHAVDTMAPSQLADLCRFSLGLMRESEEHWMSCVGVPTHIHPGSQPAPCTTYPPPD